MAERSNDINLHDPNDPGTFLERRTYRRRRLTDGLRLLPLLGLWLFMVPVLWPESKDVAGSDAVTMSSALIYIFAVWVGLIALCGAMVLAQLRSSSGDAAQDADH